MGLLTPLAVRIGALPSLPRLLPQIVRVDTRLQHLTRGRLTLLDVAGLPNLMLTVPGRRTGVPRIAPLLCVPYEGSYLVAGSNFGGPKQPDWVANLEAAGTAQVRVDGRTMTVAAERIEGTERDRLWARMQWTWPNFAEYERRTDRSIKVFRLTPVAADKLRGP